MPTLHLAYTEITDEGPMLKIHTRLHAHSDSNHYHSRERASLWLPIDILSWALSLEHALKEMEFFWEPVRTLIQLV